MKLQQSVLIGSLVAIGATTFFVEPARSQAVDQECRDFPGRNPNVTCGPFQSANLGFVNPTLSRTLRASVNSRRCFSIPGDGCQVFGMSSATPFRINERVALGAVAYFQLDSTPADPYNMNTDNVVVTNIWAQDLNPLSSQLNENSLTGFDPANPEIVPLGNTVFEGTKTGTLYTAPVLAVTLANLSTFFPVEKLSVFTGDPNSIVYLSQVTVPGLDAMAVTSAVTPEPSSFLGLLTLGILGSGLTYKRKRSGKSIKSENGEVTRV